MKKKQVELKRIDVEELLTICTEDDFVYLDPPYIGRHTDYYNSWTEDDAEELAKVARELPCGFALSMWKENEYRHNLHLETYWSGNCVRTFSHIKQKEGLNNVILGMEPSGHYWKVLAWQLK